MSRIPALRADGLLCASQDTVLGEDKERFRLRLMEQREDVLERIAEWQAAREQKLEAARRDRDSQELAACTFAPKTSEYTAPPPSGPVIVRGLGRHMELRELAARKEDDQRCVIGTLLTKIIFYLQACHCFALFYHVNGWTSHLYTISADVATSKSSAKTDTATAIPLSQPSQSRSIFR